MCYQIWPSRKFYFILIQTKESFQNAKTIFVTKELAIQQVMIHIGSLKKDMIILEKSEFSALRNENEVRLK